MSNTKLNERTSHIIVLTFTLGNGVGTDFFVVLLKCGHILTGLGEFTFLHTLRNIPVDESPLGEHQVEVLVGTRPNFGDSSRVGDHEAGTLNLGKITTWDNSGRLVVDTDLETSWAPVDELDSTLSLDNGDGSVNVLGNDITTVHHAACHVLTMTWVALNHHVGRLEDRVGDFSNGKLLVVSLLRADEWGIRAEWEVDTRIWDQVGLELGQIDVQSTIETQGSSDTRDHLSDDTVDVSVGAALDIEVTVADIVHSFVINHECAIRVLKHDVSGVHSVVSLNHGHRDVDGRIDNELELGLTAVVDRQTLKEQGTKTGTSTTTERVEDDEALETRTIVSKLSDTVQNKVDNFLTDGVVATAVVVGGVLLTRDQLLRVIDLAVSTGTDLINHSWLKIDEDGTRNVLAGTGLREEGVEGILGNTDGFVRGHLTIMVDTMLEAVQLPACVTDLNTSLTNVDTDDFSHSRSRWKNAPLLSLFVHLYFYYITIY